MSKVYRLERTQLLHCSIAEAWDFFSDPANLLDITPPNLKFKIIGAKPARMYAGQIIEYYVHPVLGIPLYWMTEITHVREHAFFSDEQRFGPYSLWHHKHFFKETAGGIEMTDIVHYKLPLWFLGDIAQALFVKKQLDEIFAFRFAAAEKRFSAK